MRVLIAFIAALLAVSVPAGRKPGQPVSRSIDCAVPPGNALDTIARPIFDQVGKQTARRSCSKPAGRRGTLGMGLAAKANPDGYTFWSTLRSIRSCRRATRSCRSTRCANSRRSFRSPVPELMVAPAARFKAFPGSGRQGQSNPGLDHPMARAAWRRTHSMPRRFRLAAGFEAVHVPFRGAPDAVREVLGGRIDFYFSPLPAVTGAGRIQTARRARSLQPQRDPNVPNIPTTLEAVSEFRLYLLGWRFCASATAEGYRATACMTKSPRR